MILLNFHLICSLIPVRGDLLHNELHHLLGVVSGLADKTAEASTMFQQHTAAFCQHLVKKIQQVASLNVTDRKRHNLNLCL